MKPEIMITVDLRDILRSIDAMNGIIEVAKENKDEDAILIFETARNVMTGFITEHCSLEDIEEARKGIVNNGSSLMGNSIL